MDTQEADTPVAGSPITEPQLLKRPLRLLLSSVRLVSVHLLAVVVVV